MPRQHDHQDATSAKCALGKRHQGQRAAFAAVVGAQDQHRVFQRDDEDQRPQDQRHHAENVPPLRALAAAACTDSRTA